MTKTYNAKLVPMDKVGFSINDICTRIKLSPAFPNEKVGTTIISINDYHSPNEQWQAQRLVITDETGKQVAEYPNVFTSAIDFSDIRRWIQSGCPDSVELEVIRKVENYKAGVTVPHSGLIPKTAIKDLERKGYYKDEPLITNNTVKMVWGEQDKAQPIAGVKTPLSGAINEYMEDNRYYPLFKHMADNHELILLETELSDIVNVVNGMKPATDWDALRDKFYAEHTELKDGVPKICTMPMDIFNFFKNELTK